MEISVNQLVAGAKSSNKVTYISDDVFNTKLNLTLIHQLIVTFLSNSRSVTKGHKNRSTVSGGKSKPWRQKGTGRARAGVSVGPLWRGGGVTFTSIPNHKKKLNKNMYRCGMRSILSELIRLQRIQIVQNVKVANNKTKNLVKLLDHKPNIKTLLIVDEVDEYLKLSSRNIKNLLVIEATEISPVILLDAEEIIVTISGIEKITEMLK